MSTWVNPLTGSTQVPEKPGDIITAAIALWVDRLNEVRNTRPRKPADKARKQQVIDTASARLHRFHGERERLSRDIRKPNKLTIALAREDLAEVQGTRECAA